MRRSARWFAPAPWRRRRWGDRRCRDDCLFCTLVADGDHVHAADGFVAIRDIAPKAETHLLVLPERHLDTFREIGELPDEETGTMLRFVARRREQIRARGLPRRRQRRARWWADGVPPALARARRRLACRGSNDTFLVSLIRIETELKDAQAAARRRPSRCAEPDPGQPAFGREGAPAAALRRRGAAGPAAGAKEACRSRRRVQDRRS